MHMKPVFIICTSTVFLILSLSPTNSYACAYLYAPGVKSFISLFQLGCIATPCSSQAFSLAYINTHIKKNSSTSAVLKIIQGIREGQAIYLKDCSLPDLHKCFISAGSRELKRLWKCFESFFCERKKSPV